MQGDETMTGNELLKRAAALFGDADPTPTAAALSCLNVLLAENFEQNTAAQLCGA
jgi:hypothetical protein